MWHYHSTIKICIVLFVYLFCNGISTLPLLVLFLILIFLSIKEKGCLLHGLRFAISFLFFVDMALLCLTGCQANLFCSFLEQRVTVFFLLLMLHRGGGLVGNVVCCDISKFNDTNTNIWHVETFCFFSRTCTNVGVFSIVVWRYWIFDNNTKKYIQYKLYFIVAWYLKILNIT